MTNHISLLICGLTFLFNQVIGQTFKLQFNELMIKKDTVEQFTLLNKWQAADSNDPELYVAYFNYYIETSKDKDIVIYNQALGDSLHLLKDPSKKMAKNVYYMQSYDKAKLDKGFTYIETGITKFPDRLDMRLGKIYMYGEIQDFKNFTSEIINVVNRSAAIDNNWLWADNKAADEMAVGESLQKYFVKLYGFYLSNDEDTSLLNYMEKIQLAILDKYPNRVVGLSNLSLVYLLKHEYDKALELLLKAEKLTPDDCVVLRNIGQVYEQKKEFKQATKYFGLMKKYGNNEEKEFAEKKIEELKRK